jgi:putative transposase
VPPVQESNYRARAQRRADPSSSLPAGGTKPEDTTNHRNGTAGKPVLTDDGPLAIEVPRDREGSFEPRVAAKLQRRFAGFDDKILSARCTG